MTEANCYRCDTEIDVQRDEWWSHGWDEQPSKANIDKARGNDEFRDWFRENITLCPDCHKRVVVIINEFRTSSPKQ